MDNPTSGSASNVPNGKNCRIFYVYGIALASFAILFLFINPFELSTKQVIAACGIFAVAIFSAVFGWAYMKAKNRMNYTEALGTNHPSTVTSYTRNWNGFKCQYDRNTGKIIFPWTDVPVIEEPIEVLPDISDIKPTNEE